MELNKLYNMDCMEGMKAFPDKFFDLAIVDPPYGISLSSNPVRQKHKKKSWDNAAPKDEYFIELNRVSKDQIIWGGNYFPFLWKQGCKGFIYWHKGNPVKNFADGELAWTSFDRVAQQVDFRYYGNLQGKTSAKDKIHPTQKPQELYDWILTQYAAPSMKILDTHGGSCSSVCAMIDFGCDWIAFEKDEDYYSKAKERIENHVKQGNLFRPEKPSYTQTKIA